MYRLLIGFVLLGVAGMSFLPVPILAGTETMESARLAVSKNSETVRALSKQEVEPLVGG